MLALCQKTVEMPKGLMPYAGHGAVHLNWATVQGRQMCKAYRVLNSPCECHAFSFVRKISWDSYSARAVHLCFSERAGDDAESFTFRFRQFNALARTA
eukprot:1434624-Pleurochrysis_carterae.AAC.1